MLFHTYIRLKDDLKKEEQSRLLLPLMKLSYPDDEEVEKKIS